MQPLTKRMRANIVPMTMSGKIALCAAVICGPPRFSPTNITL
jgi:hypothetical protein